MLEEVEDNFKKELEGSKIQNKKLKVEVESLRVCNSKIKDDSEKQKLEFLKEISNQKSVIEKLKYRLSSR